MPDVRARDVVFQLQKSNLDPKLIKVLADVAEQSYQAIKQNIELATQMVHLVDNYQNVINIAGHMKEHVDKMNTFFGEADVDPEQEKGN
jgi:hypothetical protein